MKRTSMLRRRRRRSGLKDVHAYVRFETYLYISDIAGDEGSMGMALDKMAREHAAFSKAAEEEAKKAAVK
jgi:hypothetical protein